MMTYYINLKPMAKSYEIETSETTASGHRFSFITAFAVCGLAISSWLSVSGLWVELPELVNDLPESWSLPSYMVIAIQIANVGPLLYAAATFLMPKLMKGHRGENIAIWVIIFIGMLATLLLSFYWDKKTHIFGKERSTLMLILTVVLALVDCTSTVVFLPFMASFPTSYMTAFYVGEGLSGLIPGVAGIVQGIGEPFCFNVTNGNVTYLQTGYHKPKFTIEAFFLFMFACVCLSAIAFLVILYVPECKKARLSGGGSCNHLITNSSLKSTQCLGDGNSNIAYVPELGDNAKASQVAFEIKTEETLAPSDNPLPFYEFLYLMVIIAVINGITNGLLPSFQTFAGVPYGHKSYSLSVRLSIIANPLACFIAFFVCVRSLAVFTGLTLVGIGFTIYAMVCAFGSPYPVLQDSALGGPLVVISFVMVFAILSYLKVAIASLLADRGGSRALFWCGVVTQIGSCISAIVAFVIVNHTSLVTHPHYC